MNRLVNTTLSRISVIQNRKMLSIWKLKQSHAEEKMDKMFSQVGEILENKSTATEILKVVTTHMQEIRHLEHPVSEVARDILYGNDVTWDKILTLFTKLAEEYTPVLHTSKENIESILRSQRCFTEIAEITRIGISLHKCLVAIEDKSDSVTNVNLHYGNKIALLYGTFLLSFTGFCLANMKSFSLIELISSGIRDNMEGEFVQPRNKQNKPLPCKPKLRKKDIEVPEKFDTEPLDIKHALGYAKDEWITRNVFSGAGLLGRFCRGVLMLAGHGESLQIHGYEFGKNLGLGLQIAKEYKSVFNHQDISAVSAPILFHLKRFPHFYSEFERLISNDGDIDQAKIKMILRKSEALNDTILMQRELCNRTLHILKQFSDCEARNALQNIVTSIKF